MFSRGMKYDYYECLSRSDSNKNIYDVEYGHGILKRRNYYPLIEITNGNLSCQNEMYSMNSICENDKDNKPCTLPGSTNTIDDLNPM